MPKSAGPLGAHVIAASNFRVGRIPDRPVRRLEMVSTLSLTVFGA